MTRAQQVTSGQPVAAGPVTTLPYPDAPTGTVVASEAALRKTRPWALGFAILLFMYATVGGVVGVAWLVVVVWRLIAGPPPTPPFITVWSINLLFAPIALAGGVLAIGFRAAGRAYWRRSPDDLERASIALKRLWLWAGVTVIVLIAFPSIMIAVAMFVTHDWPG